MDESFKQFEKRWKERIEGIKKQSFDGDQIFNIRHDFIKEWGYTLADPVIYNNNFIQMEQLKNDVNTALEIAYSNYRKERKGFWHKLTKGLKITIFDKLF